MKNNREHLHADDLDVAGLCFGIKIHKREKGQSDLIDLYTEDDGYYHYQTSFAAFWLDDLISVCTKAKDKADTKVIFKV